MDNIWKRDEIDSPCVKICVIHPLKKVCTGCYRSLDEIARWSQMSAEERAAVMADLPARASFPQKRRGGRIARLQRE